MALVPAPQRLADLHWLRLERIRLAAFRRLSRGRLVDLDPEVAARVVLAAQRTAVAQTDAYMAVAASMVLDAPVEPVGLDAEPLIGVRARHGRPLEEVYGGVRRVARQDGFDRGLAYLRQQIMTDAALAQRNAAHAIAEADDSVAGWRRVLNPAGGNVCGMCVAASTRVYGRSDLQPIHRQCRCTVQPIHDSSFTGRVLDRDRLEAVYERSGGSTRREDLFRIRIPEDGLPEGVDSAALDALNVRVVNDPELGVALDADRHDSHFSL